MKAGSGKRILLTGGTGFIGANLAHRLVSQGHYVAVVTREYSNRARLQQLAGKIHFLTADLLEAKGLQQAVSTVDPEVVYHLASTPFNPPTITAQTHMQMIALGTLNLLEALAGRSNVRVIYTGSGAEYGSGERIREDAPLRPATMLGAAKAAASILVQTYARLHQMETVVVRLFSPYGPWERPSRLIPHIILSALAGQDVRISSGEQHRDYLYIDDVVDALLMAAFKPVPPGSVFNISSGQGAPIRDVVQLILQLMESTVRVEVGALPTRPDEIWKYSGDNTAARRILQWQPRTSLENGLRKTIAWFTEHRELASNLV